MAPHIFRDRKIDIGEHIDIEVDQKALISQRTTPRLFAERRPDRPCPPGAESAAHRVCLSFGFAGRDVVDGEVEDAPGSQQWTPWPEIDEMSCCVENIEEMATPVQRAVAGFRGV